MANSIVPGTIAAEAGSMTRAILDVFESLLDPAIFAASETGLKRFSNAIAVGVCGNIVASITDTKYLQVDGGEIIGGDGGGGGGGAPTDAEYLVGAANGTLSAERLVTNTTTITWDVATPGQAKANVADVTGVSGELADPQPPKLHASTHSAGQSDEVDVTDLGGYPGGGTTFLRDDGVFAAVGASGIVDFQSWEIPGTYTGGVDGWTKPSSGAVALIVCTGGGGGGGGGGNNTTNSNRVGGCGGGGGAKSWLIVPLSQLGATETVVVGSGGTGGGATSDGSDGTASTFGAAPIWCFGGGGGGGYRGGNSAISGGGGGGGGTASSGSVGALSASTNEGGPGRSLTTSNVESTAQGGTGCRGGFNTTKPLHAERGGGGGGGRSSTAAQLGGTSLYGAGGGGAGGSYTSTTSRAPEAGGQSGEIADGGGGGAAGANSTGAATAGTDGADATHVFESGAGGGGGGAAINIDNVANPGTAGGNGGFPGGGGGGGGAAENSVGGDGGNGGGGAVYVWVW